MRRRVAIMCTVLVTGLLAAVGCSGGGGVIETERPVIDVAPWGAPFVMTPTSDEVGTLTDQVFAVRNYGDAPLTITSVELTEATTPGFTLVVGDTLPVVLEPFDGDGGERVLTFTVTFEASETSGDASATVRITHDDEALGGVSTLTIEVDPGAPRMRISPEVIDMGQVAIGTTSAKEILVQNVGQTDLHVESFALVGDIGTFATDIRGLGLMEPLSEEMAEGVVFTPPLVVPPDGKWSFSIAYTASDATPHEATLVLVSDDPVAGERQIPISANTDQACVVVNPAIVQFGGKQIGTTASLPVEILSCGSIPLEVSDLTLTAVGGSSSVDQFDIMVEGVGSLGEGTLAPSADAPLVLLPGEKLVAFVTYAPGVESVHDVDGQPILDEATLTITSNALTPSVDVGLSGFGASGSCPVAIIDIQEGEEVIPQTKLHLAGDGSYAPDGSVVKWEWTVTQPAGSTSVLSPSPSFPNPVLEANVAGEYTFGLRIWDSNGLESCEQAVATVLVKSQETLHIELLWTSPGDPDETDTGAGAGTDLDLHFAHQAASTEDIDGDGEPDPWFDTQWDCFWYYPIQNWGSYSSIDDDPSLDRDDTDGAGPENVNLDEPEDGVTYSVGVHYWDDHAYGASYATLRVYVYGILVAEVSQVKLVNGDMWDALRIHWPSGEVELVTDGDGYAITPDYQGSGFGQP